MAYNDRAAFWGGFVDWIGPYLHRWILARVSYVLASPVSSVLLGLGFFAEGHWRVFWLTWFFVTLVVMTFAEVVRQSYSRHLQESEDMDEAARVVTLRDALRPLATDIADMQTLTLGRRRTRVDEIARRGAEALALIMVKRIDGFRSVAYRKRGDDVVAVIESCGRSENPPQDFVRDTPRGEAAFMAIERRKPCFVRDVEDKNEVDTTIGAYYGTRIGYRTFISAPIADKQQAYGMLTIDAPNPGDLLKSDQYLVMLVADMLAIAFASVR